VIQNTAIGLLPPAPAAMYSAGDLKGQVASRRRNASSRCWRVPGPSIVRAHGVEPIRQVLKQMAHPPTGPVGSRQAAVRPNSGDEGDDSNRSKQCSRIRGRLEVDYRPMPQCCRSTSIRLT